MTDRVQCAECGRTFDSEEHPFCPACGALERASDPGSALDLAARRDPRKRPVQAAGVMMVTLGALAMVMFIATAVLAPSLVPQTIEAVADMEGGAIHVHVVDGSAPVAGANVTVWSLDGTALQNRTTDSAGWANFTALSQAGVNVTIGSGERLFLRHVLSLSPDSGGTPVLLAVDVADDDLTEETWEGVSSIVQASRILAGIFAVVAGMTVAGGVSALRLRRRTWALAGAVVALLPSLLLAMVNWMFILFPVLFGVAVLVFVRGRPLFAD